MWLSLVYWAGTLYGEGGAGLERGCIQWVRHAQTWTITTAMLCFPTPE